MENNGHSILAERQCRVFQPRLVTSEILVSVEARKGV